MNACHSRGSSDIQCLSPNLDASIVFLIGILIFSGVDNLSSNNSEVKCILTNFMIPILNYDLILLPSPYKKSFLPKFKNLPRTSNKRQKYRHLFPPLSSVRLEFFKKSECNIEGVYTPGNEKEYAGKSLRKILQIRNIVRSLPGHWQVYRETFLGFQADRWSIGTRLSALCALTVSSLNGEAPAWKILWSIFGRRT